ncbi:tryptophan 7-halogenase [Asticcacaulis tiandongensis]|uniref:tryptophan 7-halogenase n=1 Tax=Asticcacaulis tiandongensis TaxID=2565365 RepID=UPI0015E84209|nr:tryptophan 7-halogenase [Asticcacaulis tiandongensis]
MTALRHLVIIGDSYAAWMAAAFLGHSLKALDGRQLTQVSVVATDAPQSRRALSAPPSFRAFNARIGLNEAQLFTAAKALPFYGSQYDGFGDGTGSGAFWRAFGDYGVRLNTAPFHHFLTWQAQQTGMVDIDDYAPAVKLAASGRFTPPVSAMESPLSGVGHGLNLDTAAYRRLLKTASPMVRVIEGTLSGFSRDELGRVSAIQLEGGQTVEADFFIDADGWLTEQRNVPFVAAVGLSHDRAIEVGALHADERAANHITAVDGGFMLRRPVGGEDRIRLVYDSRQIDTDQARNLLGDMGAEAEIETFVQGRRTAFWQDNVLSIGEASGVLDGIGLHELMFVQHELTQFLALFPDQESRPELAREYNRVLTQSFDRTADFARLHYAESGWSESVRQKVSYFRSRGYIQMLDDETASEADFLSLLWGRGIRPERYDRTIDALDKALTLKRLEQMRNIINHEINRLPSFAVLRQQIEQAASGRA